MVCCGWRQCRVPGCFERAGVSRLLCRALWTEGVSPGDSRRPGHARFQDRSPPRAYRPRRAASKVKRTHFPFSLLPSSPLSLALPSPPSRPHYPSIVRHGDLPPSPPPSLSSSCSPLFIFVQQQPALCSASRHQEGPALILL
jgi:hypothetical protein